MSKDRKKKSNLRKVIFKRKRRKKHFNTTQSLADASAQTERLLSRATDGFMATRKHHISQAFVSTAAIRRFSHVILL